VENDFDTRLPCDLPSDEKAPFVASACIFPGWHVADPESECAMGAEKSG
jgi:hypothetical protein